MDPLTIQQAFDLAVKRHHAGQLSEAEKLYRQILSQQPQHSGATYYLGMIAHQSGRNDIAVDLIRRSIALGPNYHEAHYNLGIILMGQGKLDEAIGAFSQAIALNPTFPQAHNSLGNALIGQGQLEKAIAAFCQAIIHRPGYAEAYCNLGNALESKGELGEAIVAYRHALAVRPDFADAQSNLGTALQGQGQLDEAIEAYRVAIVLRPSSALAYSNLASALREKGKLDDAIAVCRQAIVLDPNLPEAHINLGDALRHKGQLDEAIAACQRAIALRPGYAEAHNDLGNTLKDRGDLNAAIAAYRKAISLAPDFSAAHSNLGNALKSIGLLDEALASHRQAVALKPTDADVHYNLGSVLEDQGLVDDAIPEYRRAIALSPNHHIARSNLIFAMQLHPDYDAPTIAEEHRRWNDQHAEPLREFIHSHSNDANPNRRLRIGYVSPDFREHSVSRFLLPLLTHHDKNQVEVFGYSHVSRPDEITVLIRSHVDQWRSVSRLSDPQLAEQIRRDQIDILVDLAGHTGDNRLLIFARKPAPIQATWLGYPNTTGLAAMDYRLTDALADPPGISDALCSERLIRLPETAWCFEAPTENLPLAEKTQTAAMPITFGSFNNFSKITTPMLELWVELLRSTPGSRLVIKARALGCESTGRRVRQTMEALGVTSDRLELHGWRKSHEDHLASYRQINIALDTFPYHGTTTTCEALWMGVPVITLAGHTHISRVGVSLLTNMGLPELIAENSQDYIKIAVELSNNLPQLSHLHSTLRRRMQQSSLMDAPRFARNIEAAYRRMWHTWCRTGSSAG
jgi:predicted O-linked N-acetylglucosamine transferase (SPINDLY family)